MIIDYVYDDCQDCHGLFRLRFPKLELLNVSIQCFPEKREGAKIGWK